MAKNMTKIAYLRKVWAEKYDENDLEAAAEIGEALLREHWHNKSMRTVGYANDLFNLACVHEDLGNFERAVAYYSDAAQQHLAANGDELSYADRVNSLASALVRNDLPGTAFVLLENVAAIRRKLLGRRNLIYADSLYNLANAAADIGRTKDAIHFHMEALKIRETDAPIVDIVSSLHSIAFLYESDENYEKAILFAKSAAKFSASDDIAYAKACNYLAELYEAASEYESALPLYDEVLEIAGGETNRSGSAYLNVALRRANLLSLLNRPEEALAAHEKICESFPPGATSVFYANCLRGMAMLHSNLNNPARAEECILKAMKIRRTMYEDITLDITFLIRLHLRENNTEKALEALIYALMCSGQNSPEYNEMLEDLVSIFDQTKNPATGEFVNAIELLNDREKLRPILNKWEAWEKGG